MKYCSDSFDVNEFTADIQELMQTFLNRQVSYNTQKFARHVIEAIMYFYFLEGQLLHAPIIKKVDWDADTRLLEVKFCDGFEEEMAAKIEEIEEQE